MSLRLTRVRYVSSSGGSTQPQGPSLTYSHAGTMQKDPLPESMHFWSTRLDPYRATTQLDGRPAPLDQEYQMRN